MSNLKQPTSNRGNGTTSKALRAAIAIAGVEFILIAVLIYQIIPLGLLSQAFTTYAVLLLFVFTFGLTLRSIALIRRGRAMTGLNWIYYPMLVIIASVALLYEGRGLTASVFATIAAIVFIRWVYPPQVRRRPTIAAIITIGLAVLIEWINPAFRLPNPTNITRVGPALAVIFVLLFAGLLLRQLWNNNIRAKLIIAFVTVTITTLGLVTIIVDNTVRAALTQQIGDSFVLQAEGLSNQINRHFLEKISQLQAATVIDLIKEALEERNDSYTGSQDEIMADILNLDAAWVAASDNDPLIAHIISNNPAINPTAFQLYDFAEAFADHAEIFLTDRYGATVAATGRLSDYYQADETWWQAAWHGGEGAVYISDPVYGESADIIAVQIAVPVYAEETGELLGILRSTLEMEDLYTTLENETIGETGYVLLFNKQGDLLVDPRAETDSATELPITVRREIVESKNHFDFHVDHNGHEILIGTARIAGKGSAISASEEAFNERAEASILLAVENLDWVMAVRQNTDEAFAAIDQTIQRILYISMAAILATIVVAAGLAQVVVAPLVRLTTTTQAFASGNLSAQAVIETQDEIGKLALAFNNMAGELHGTLNTLEQQVSERTQALEQRSAYLEGAADISQAAASILEPDKLIQQVVNLIKDRFDLYYVGLFLVDERNEWAVLQAGTGQAGQQMLARAHRLKVGAGMIGWSVAHAEARIALDVGEDAVRFENPDLPETRSEGALPLRSRGRVLGALTVQSSAEAAFNQDIITTLQTMADQVAVALDNAELFARSQKALESERRAYGELSHEAWIALSQSQAIPRYLCTPEGALYPIAEQQEPETLQALENGQILQDDGATAVIPIKSRGQILGGFKIRKPKDGGTWTAEQLKLMETIAEQLGMALESARLYQDTQRQAKQEQIIGEVTQHMRETLEIETVLKTAATEMRRVLALEEVEVHLSAKNINTDMENKSHGA